MRVIEKFLHPRTVGRLRTYARETRLHRSSLTGWGSAVSGVLAPVLQWDLPDKIADAIKGEIIDTHHLEPYHEYTWQSSIHFGPRLSYIPWHNDANHVVNITVYLNDSWRADDQGYFIYDEGDGLRAIIPQPNVGLVYETPLMHMVTLTNIQAPVRESLQIFINNTAPPVAEQPPLPALPKPFPHTPAQIRPVE